MVPGSETLHLLSIPHYTLDLSDNLHITHKYKVSCHTSYTLSSLFTSSCGKCGSTVWMRIKLASDHVFTSCQATSCFPERNGLCSGHCG